MIRPGIPPTERVVVWKSELPSEQQRIIDIGTEAIRAGHTAAVIMSGGQGTRLGFSGPKGMYDIGLLSGKPIFQIHIERIAKLKANSTLPGHQPPKIPIYIMTSDLNDLVIREYFKQNAFFGYAEDEVFFFEQGLQPCLDFNGKIIIESESSLALAPDGNGGIYHALQSSGALADMCQRQVKYLHVYGIDNVLTKSVDPAFMGLCISRGIECGNKVVWRAHKGERVGVTACNSDGRMCVIEYSEIPKEFAEAEDSNGRLLYGAANICNHFLSVDFLINVVLPSLSSSYHLANKKIPYFDPVTKQQIQPTVNNGVKLEMFIFDVFPLATNWIVMEIDREDEFAPVKNAPGDPTDSPDTARAMMSALAVKWLRAAGASVLPDVSSGSESFDNCEISPLVSYGGEGLEAFAGQTIQLPRLIA